MDKKCECPECRKARGQEPLERLGRDETRAIVNHYLQEVSAVMKKLSDKLPEAQIMLCGKVIAPVKHDDNPDSKIVADVIMPAFGKAVAGEMVLGLEHLKSRIIEETSPFAASARGFQAVDFNELLGRFAGGL